jgi:hypothetical protein
MTTHSLKSIISKISEIQSQISLGEIRLAGRRAQAFQDLQEKVLQQITHLVRGIERDLSTRNLTGADLAIRSRRGYQWLKFLSQPDSLLSHLDALQRINLFLVSDKGRSIQDYSVSLYHQGSLYKIHHHDSQRELIAQESFLTAPDRILQALLAVAKDPTQKGSRTILREYTFSKEYQQVRETLEYLGIPPGSFSAGKVHHLGQSFQRVNQEYFQGKLARPHLVWSRRLTHRKFGHYQWDTDTVMVSSSLDQKQIPEMIVDFVIYHELLHKKIGAKRVNQNRIAHTREFREAENQFRQVEKARQLLNRIAQKGIRYKS